MNTIIDYKVLTEQVRRVLSISEAMLEELRLHIPETFSSVTMDSQTEAVINPALADLLSEPGHPSESKEGTTQSVALSVYLLLYIRLYKASELSACRAYGDFRKCFEGYAGENISRYLFDKLCFYCLLYRTVEEPIPGEDLFRGYDVNQWPDVELTARTLPFVRISFPTVLTWLSEVAAGHSGDPGLNEVAQFVYEWALQDATDILEIEDQLTAIAVSGTTAEFLSPLLSAAKERNGKTAGHYMDLLHPVILPANAYTVLYALGRITDTDDPGRDKLYGIIWEYYKNDFLTVASFVNLCHTFLFYRAELFGEIERVLPGTEDVPLVRAVILVLLDQRTNEIGADWRDRISQVLMTKDSAELTPWIGHYLRMTAGKDVLQAYNWLEYRMRSSVSLKKLDDAMSYLFSRDVTAFQERLITWLIAEDDRIHTGLHVICSVVHTQVQLFKMPKERLSALSARDKIFFAYKVAGYVYSMEPMQWLIVSLVKSVEAEHPLVRGTLYYILHEYVIYNYRTTLDIFRTEVNDPEANTAFTLSLFRELIEQYETYFSRIRGVEAEKELAPYKDDAQLKNFYARKQYRLDPAAVRSQSVARFFKTTQVHSDRYAVRRAGQLKHEVVALSTISIKSEFPSGEKLNPVFQEYIRRTYQKLRKHEIDID